MPPDGTSGTYVLYRMLPPGTHKYYFTVGNQVVVAKD
jgi:hypothetical protein